MTGKAGQSNDLNHNIAYYLQWWQNMGVAHACNDDVMQWLSEEKNIPIIIDNHQHDIAQQNIARAEQRQNANRPAQNKPAPAMNRSAPTNHHPMQDNSLWPQNMEQFKHNIANNIAMPCDIGTGKKLMPHFTDAAKIMIISDMPTKRDVTEQRFYTGEEGIFLKNMLQSINVRADECNFANLITTSPMTEMIIDSDLPILGQFLLHLIHLQSAPKVIIFGAVAAKALFNAEMINLRGNLQNFNHKDVNKSGIVTLHPRVVLQKTSVKRQLWQDLSLLF
ncbi:hypothetical protein LPB140_07325 [Sphingorhabdus lutea]|uniref:Uracil-DNA glycosylase-like domain-containing protein n=1 Tax=Sphingorhabdus lutea TaxID=1913578 RepID=A0A1L3JBX4_9SPHN|nr:uracil-DNA glycosylase family protein [Sphingorhabdus lutea]APG62628.1 hypothetical protein LPB140_07325 [Sphingorhabdus lutea]